MSHDQTFRERAWMCVVCGYTMDSASLPEKPGAVPTDGDVSLCLNCGAVYVREGDKWRPMTKAEKRALEPENREKIERYERARRRMVDVDLSRRGGRA